MSRIVPGLAPNKQKHVKLAPGPSFDKSAGRESEESQTKSGKPDKAAHDRQVQSVDAEIQKLQDEQNALRNKMNTSDPKTNPLVQQRNALRQELNTLREQQAGSKASRGRTMDQVKTMQDKLQAKIKEVQAAKSKFPFKSTAEVDNRIALLDKQVESGNLKLVDERKTLNEISTLKRSRKTIEGFQSQQDSIEADKKAIEEHRKALDDPEAKAASEKYNTLKAELDKLNDQMDESSKSRNKHYEDRDALKKQIDEQYTKKRELRDAFRLANDVYYTKVNEERTRRMEKMRTEKAAHEESKRKAVNERLLEEASAPAFEREIEDCRTLINYFNQGRNAPAPTLLSPANGQTTSPIQALQAVPALDIRKVDSAFPEGQIALKKKGGKDDEDWFGGAGKKKKGAQKAGKINGATGEEDSIANLSLNLPMSTLAGLLALEIAAPLSQNDVSKTIEALQEKQKWMEANQDRVTKERVEKAQARIDRAGKAVPLEDHKGAPRIDTNGFDGRDEADLALPQVEKVTLGENNDATQDADEPATGNADAEPVTRDELAKAEAS